MKRIGWGMIGCGDVTQVKSGPAFNKVESSFIAAVMSRNLDKAKQYAAKNNITHYYDDVQELLANPEVNAVYIATPPSSHEAYAMTAINAGKDLYIEKPMAMNHVSAMKIIKAAEQAGVKLVIAHYRREQPVFKKVKQLIEEGAIGKVRLAVCNYQKIKQSTEELEMPGNKWRVDPTISGGGIFHDLAPHQLDLMLYFFGDFNTASGISKSQMGIYEADDIVAGTILFKDDIIFSGVWLLNGLEYIDRMEITGTRGKIWFGAFQHEKLYIESDGKQTVYTFENLTHVQLPLIDKTVKYFLNAGPNPCEAINGLQVMQIIDSFTPKS